MSKVYIRSPATRLFSEALLPDGRLGKQLCGLYGSGTKLLDDRLHSGLKKKLWSNGFAHVALQMRGAIVDGSISGPELSAGRLFSVEFSFFVRDSFFALSSIALRSAGSFATTN